MFEILGLPFISVEMWRTKGIVDKQDKNSALQN
jgi:hypothetical protein